MASAPYDICACPSCGSRFRVTAAQLASADGQVRCGACLALFDGRAMREAPAAADAGRPGTGIDSARPAPRQSGPHAPAPVAARAESQQATASHARRPRTGWRLAGVIALGAALGANAMALRQQSRQPDLSAFEAAGPLAVERTTSPKGFTVTGRLTNRASFPQPLPSLLVRLQDDAATIAETRFRPPAYLADVAGKTLGDRALAPNESATVLLRIPDAGDAATAATLALVWPP